MLKALKIYVLVMFAVLVWQVVDVMQMIGLNKAQCNARGAEIVVHGNGNKICRYVRK